MFIGEQLGRAIKEAIKKKGVTQVEVAKVFGVKPPSVNGWIKTGNIDKIHLALLMEYFSDVTTPEDFGFENVPISSMFPRIVNEGDFVFIPQYSARGACGDGEENNFIEIKRKVAFSREWIESVGLKEKNLEVIYASGDSMFPTIADGATVLIDTSQKEPMEGKVFSIHRNMNGDIIKRLALDKNGDWVYGSDNINKSLYNDLHPLKEDYIIGRVVWQGGYGGLL